MCGKGGDVIGEGNDTADHVSVYGARVLFFVLVPSRMLVSYMTRACFPMWASLEVVVHASFALR